MERFTVEEAEKLLAKVLGESFVPVAHQEYDEEVLEVVKDHIELVKGICLELRDVRNRFINSDYASCKAVAVECDKFIDWLDDFVE